MPSLSACVIIIIKAVTFLYRASGAEAPGNGPFTDVAAGSYCYDAVNWAAATGVTSGRSDTIFAPGDACSRANIVTFLYNYFLKTHFLHSFST